MVKIDEDLKKQIVHLAIAERRTYKSLAAEFGYSDAVISRVVKEYIREAEANEQKAHALEQERKIAELLKENDELKKENDFLKKASAFFLKGNQ